MLKTNHMPPEFPNEIPLHLGGSKILPWSKIRCTRFQPSASAGVKICLANLAKDPNFL